MREFDFGRDPSTKVTTEFNTEMLELRRQEEELLALQQVLDARQKKHLESIRALALRKNTTKPQSLNPVWNGASGSFTTVD